MVNFTNLRSKALSLVALMALSSTAVFAQSGKSNFETATDAASLKGAKKIFLYDGDKKVGFPVDNGTLVKGVSLAIQEEGGMAIDKTTGLFNTGANVGDLAFEKMPQLSPNDLNASYWFGNDGKLNIFTRKAQATAVLDFSTKYLHNVRNLSMTLGENRMGSTPSLKTNYHVVAFIYNLDGTKAPLKGIYKSHAGVEENYFEVESPYSLGTKAATAVADTTITLFVNDKDGATTDLIPYSLDNKIIRVAIYSDMPTSVVAGSGGHFLPALTIADCGIEFDKPSISLAVDAWDFNAGACGISEQEGKLTFVAKNVTGPEAVKIVGNTGFTNDFTSFVYKTGKDADSVKYEAPYVFTPKGISEGAFYYKATVNANKTDVLSPIELSATHEKTIAYNSKPVVVLAEDHVRFDNPQQTKEVVITGYNIPVYNRGSFAMLDYSAFEKFSSDQLVSYADLAVTEEFDIAPNGKIVPLTGATTSFLKLDFDQSINDISRDEAFLVSAKDWSVKLCDNSIFTGKDFPSLIARGNVAQLWFTYMGKSVIGTPSITPDNVFFSRHDASQPYDDARHASRVKKYMLHGTAVTATTGNMATINVDLQVGKLGAAGQDHLEMRYSLTDPASAEFTGWTNATIKQLQITLNTADQAALENFLTNGIPVYVQYVPRCDGFTQGAAATTEAGFAYGWNPHEFVLSAAVDDNGVSNTATTVNLYGDTRAALSSNMNELHSLYVMGGTQTVSPIGKIVNDWMTGAQADGSVVVPAFRKSYGDIYNGCESSLYWKVDSFMVAGYNLKKAVALTQTRNTKYDGAFSTEVRMLAGTTDGVTLTPNNFGELIAVVKVYFAQNPIDKKAGLVKAEDLLTVSTDEATLVMAGQEKRKVGNAFVTAKAKQYYDFFNIGGNVNNTPGVAHNTVNGFNYVSYSEGAEVFGFIYQPTLTFDFIGNKELTAAVGKDTTAQFWVRGTEFNPLNNRAVTLNLKTATGTPFSIAPVTGSKKAAINDAGSFAELYQVTYAPTSANLCEKGNTIQLGAQCATALTAEVSGIPTWNATSLELNPLDFGDIHGSMAKISWTPVAGAAWYQVEVGHWKPEFTSEDVFISECKAAEGSDQIVVEVFNGTGKVINKDMMVNYYLQFEQFDAVTGKMIGKADIPAKGSNLDNELLNTNVTMNGWNYDAVKYVYTAPINNKYTYNVKLMQGGVQIDIFSFGQAGAHLARTAAAVRDAESKITKAATIKRNDGKFDQSAWETFNTSLPNAHFEWKEYSFFDMKDGGRSEMISKTSTTINNLKANTNYDVRVSAYNDCIIGGAEGLRIPVSYDALNFLTMSELVTSSGNIEFSDEIGWPTGNGPIEVSAVNVYANNGKIFVAGAEGNVTICNILGAAVAQVSAETATQGIAVNAGVYVVRVNGEKGVKCIVK